MISKGNYMRVLYRQELVSKIKRTPQNFVEEKLNSIKLASILKKIILLRFCEYVSIKQLSKTLNLSSMSISRKTQKALDLIERSRVFKE